MTVETVGTVPWAAGIAERHLAVLGNRWRHTQAVAARATEVAGAVPDADRDLLLAAAWLHDVGYGPQLRDTGFHPIDGARHLAKLGVEFRLCALVAHHSGALYEAAERGLAQQLARYPREDGPVLDALVLADMTTGPSGERFEFEERMDEIARRYAAGDPVNRAMRNARPYLRECVSRALQRLPD